jgi:lipopolysaccharide/colanic/teichoic acid biosynthesis glycosyltransferase
MKRLSDMLAAAILLILLLPVFGLVALAIRCRMGMPILFKQERAGKDGHLFTLLKFRTMRSAPEACSSIQAVATDADRLTSLGRFLRRTSLDELPQLWNVLKGEMSLVGPRPLLPEYLPHYTASQFRRHEVRPGITGWAQVRGRNALSWEDRFALDVWYIENRSLALDLWILLLTIGTLFRPQGLRQEGQATMSPFVTDARRENRDAL